MRRQKQNPNEYIGPDFIQIDDKWALPEHLTVDMWIEARQAANGDDKHSLRQFKMATLMLEAAEQYGLLQHRGSLMQVLDQVGAYKPAKPKADLKLVDICEQHEVQ
jgi:hypothetical protein